MSAEEQQIAEAAAQFIPTRHDLHLEVARRVLANANLVPSLTELRDQVLIILADYRNHAWADGRLKNERDRLLCADAIMAKLQITIDNIEMMISSTELREGAHDALLNRASVRLHRLRGCDVRPDWDASVGVELVCVGAEAGGGTFGVAANGNATWMATCEMRDRADRRPATTAWFMLRMSAEEATEQELAAAREHGEAWADTHFDALVDESSRKLSDNVEITGSWNRHPAGFPPCADGVAEDAARATWARLVEEEALAVANEALERRGIECKNHEAIVELGERLVADRANPVRPTSCADAVGDEDATIDAWLRDPS